MLKLVYAQREYVKLGEIYVPWVQICMHIYSYLGPQGVGLIQIFDPKNENYLSQKCKFWP
jgi:hypothetical protein